MHRKLVSLEPKEIEWLARKHGTSVEKVRDIMERTGSRSRKEVDAALIQQYENPNRESLKHAR